MTKKELLEMYNYKCEHRHNGLSHQKCYERWKREQVKEGYLDIEVTNLAANFGYVLSWFIKTRGKDEFKYGVVDKKDVDKGDFDKTIIQQCIEALNEYDRVYTYYGTRLDIPYLRTRALYHNLSFPLFGMIKHTDLYYHVKSRLKINSNRLETACRTLGIEGKTHLDGKKWMQASCGNKDALNYVVDHNKWDVIILEKLHERLEDYYKGTNRSI